MKKRWLIPILVIIAPILILAVIFGAIAIAMNIDIANSPSPGAPAITRAEFPFTLVYERDGEEIVVSDTLICEYVGDKWSDGHGKKFRNWEESYGSGVEEIILAERSFDNYDVSIEFHDGYSAAYLMGDTEHFNYACGGNYGYNIRKESQWSTSWSALSKDKLYSEYGVRIISFEMDAEPIENSFAPAD